MLPGDEDENALAMRALLAADKSSSLQPLVEVNEASVAVGDRGRKALVGGECGDTSCTESQRDKRTSPEKIGK